MNTDSLNNISLQEEQALTVYTLTRAFSALRDIEKQYLEVQKRHFIDPSEELTDSLMLLAQSLNNTRKQIDNYLYTASIPFIPV